MRCQAAHKSANLAGCVTDKPTTARDVPVHIGRCDRGTCSSNLALTVAFSLPRLTSMPRESRDSRHLSVFTIPDGRSFSESRCNPQTASGFEQFQ